MSVLVIVLLSIGCNSNLPTPPVTISDEQLIEVSSLLVGSEKDKMWFMYLETDTMLYTEDDVEHCTTDITEYIDSLNSPVYTFTRTLIKIGMLKDSVLDDDNSSQVAYLLDGNEQGHIIIRLNSVISPQNGFQLSDYYEIMSISTDSLRLRRYLFKTDNSAGNLQYNRFKDFYFVTRDFYPDSNSPVEVDDDFSRAIISNLTNNSKKEWYLCYKADTTMIYYQDGTTEVSPGMKWAYDLTDTKLWMFNNDHTINTGDGRGGFADYKSEMSFTIQKNRDGTYFINTINDKGKEELFEIVCVDKDSMHLLTHTHTHATENIPEYYKTTDYYWCAYEYSALSEKKGNVEQLIIGEWLLLKSQTIVDYFEGFTSQQGLTHTDSTIVYSTHIPYLRIDENKDFALGNYVDGDVYLSPTPADLGINNKQQTYFTVLNADGDIQIHFHNFYIRLKDSKYTTSDRILIVDRVSSDSLIAHSNIYIKTMGIVNGVLSNINVGQGKTIEQWVRKK